MADLTTVADVKAWLGITGAQNDAVLARLVTAASAAAEAFMSRKIAAADYTERGDGASGETYVPRRQPVNSVASLSIGGVTVAASPDGIQAGYMIDGNQVVLVGGPRFCRGRQNVLLAYNAGYATVPPDIAQAVIETVGLSFKRGQHVDVSSKSLAGESITFVMAELPKSAKDVLNQYKQVAPL